MVVVTLTQHHAVPVVEGITEPVPWGARVGRLFMVRVAQEEQGEVQVVTWLTPEPREVVVPVDMPGQAEEVELLRVEGVMPVPPPLQIVVEVEAVAGVVQAVFLMEHPVEVWE